MGMKKPEHRYFSDFRSEKRPKMIVLALCAPKRKIENLRSNSNKRMNHEAVIHRRRPLCGGGAATTAVSICKITGISSCSCNLLGLKLSGCAVISKGIVVVEGEISCIRRCMKFMLWKKQENCDCAKVIWQVKVAKPNFGKFSILHCSSEVAISKFFADHGASLYWDLAVKSDLNS